MVLVKHVERNEVGIKLTVNNTTTDKAYDEITPYKTAKFTIEKLISIKIHFPKIAVFHGVLRKIFDVRLQQPLVFVVIKG